MEPMYRRILVELLDDAVAGRLRAPRVEEVAAGHACSAGAAREALRALEERGVVALRRGRGYVVLPQDRWRLLDADVAAAMLVRSRDGDGLRQAIEAVRLVETQAARLAATRSRPGDLQLLRDAVERMRNGSDGAAIEFHRTLALLSGNAYLASMLDALQPVIARASRARSDHVVALHERIVAALVARDPTAAAAAADDLGRRLAGWARV